MIKIKSCPEGKVLNPKTGRCIKKENLEKQTKKAKPAEPAKPAKPAKPAEPPAKPAIKECPEGKVLNPKTGRCIKKENLKKQTKKTNTGAPSVPVAPAAPAAPAKKSSHSSSSSAASSKKISKGSDNDIDLYYPDIDDSDFGKKIARNKEFSIHKIRSFPTIRTVEDFNKVANELCGKFETTLYQHFISQYLSHRTPYKSIMLY